jgi:hypothetical protein
MRGEVFVRLLPALVGSVILITEGQPGLAACVGDCDGDESVALHEVIIAVNIALGRTTGEACVDADPDRDGVTRLDELVAIVGSSLDDCAVPTPTPQPTPTPTAAEAVPTSGAELVPWLQAGRYLDWPSESSIHASAGPHFGNVRVYLNDALFDSLEAGVAEHPAGSVAVKELYGSGTELRGWSVMVKVQDLSAGGDGWYWFERFGSSTYADGLGEAGCTGCHSLGSDYVRIPFPLQQGSNE